MPCRGSRSSTPLNHTHQTLDFVLEKKREYLSLNRKTMTVWEALELPEHARRRQRSRHRLHPDRARAADGRGHPRRQPAALVHRHRPGPRSRQDPLPVRRAAVGGRRRHVPGRLPLVAEDRLQPVLQRQSRPAVPEYQTENGIYEPGCGLDNVHMSWGHDEYVVPRRQGSTAARKRSTCCATTPSTRGTRKSEYSHLLNETDRSMLKWVRAFNRYDLYSKGSAAAEGRRADAVLRGPGQGVLPGAAPLVDARHARTALSHVPAARGTSHVTST